MRFSDIPGLTETKSILINSVKNNHIAHAQLFAGREGGANLAMALAYATFLNCKNKKEDDSCGECPSCLKADKLIHPDLHFVFPVSSTKDVAGKDALSSSFMKEWRTFISTNPFGGLNEWSTIYGGENKQVNISKEESRSVINSLMLTSYEGGFKIMIIWLPEYMHVYCANAILKILEEPPKKTIIILVSNDVEALLNTIISRSQMFQIRQFEDDELKDILVGKFKADSEQAARVVPLSEGSVNEALALLENTEDDNHCMFRDWMRYCYSKDYTQLVLWADKFQKLNKISQKSLLQYGLSMMRETLITQYQVYELSRTSGEEIAFTNKFSKALSPDKVENISILLNKSFYFLERNANAKIVFLDLSLSIAKVFKT